MTLILIPRETTAGETRVAATPETVGKLLKRPGIEVAIERGAGSAAGFTDADYETAGARLVAGGDDDWRAADAVLVVRPPAAERAAALGRTDSAGGGALLVGLLSPYDQPDLVRALAAAGATSLAMELVPRISRAQSMDALSSQASIAGYEAVLLAAHRLDRYFPLLMTAAGTIPPSKVVVMGAGVAGLQAIATARRLGAVVEVSDIREAVKEQVQSLGGKFIELPELEESGEGAGGYAREMGEDFLRRQREIVARHVAAADVVITTALIPGKPAPRLVTAEMVRSMRPGAVIVDLAVVQGGNCELSQADQEVVEAGVRILAPSNLAAGMARDASTLYARNVVALLDLVLAEDGSLAIDRDDEVVAGALLTHSGQVVHGPTAAALEEVTT